VLSQDSDSQ
jgi:RNA recognition motif-containing protein